MAVPPPADRRRHLCGAAAGLAALTLAGCALATPGDSGDSDGISVVATTGVLADLARNVVGDRATVTSLVPDGGDPHSYEPSLRDVRDVVYADVAFSNYMLLEEHNIIKMLDANLPDGVPNVSLAESAVKYAAEIIPLVENVNLDTIWLGLAVSGTGEQHGATRSSDVLLRATDLDGPGQLTGYLTETFGQPRIYFDSADGFDGSDVVTLPTDAHTHMSWTFSEPGVYRLTLAAELLPTPEADPVAMGSSTVTFAVGIDPYSVSGAQGAEVLDGGHADLSVQLDAGEIVVASDSSDDVGGHHHLHDPDETVISIPNKALAPVPAGQDFRFLGRAGEQIYQLPQAVLGKHVHGEIDPHLWQDVRNAQAYVEIIRDTLVAADPEGADEYRANADAYLRTLEETDAYVQATIAEIPRERRYLVTTHDAFAYLGAAYDLDIAGFVTPNPATEPSVAERAKLTQTVRTLEVPAVFLEPNLAARSSVLTEVAKENGVQVCPIYSDAFDAEVTTYVEMMRANADSLRRCLS
ncbi:anchored repeat ABC transporter, substrate-binding protein [Oerskovia flava]|uniref:anchored repeat ABC transporter, substrate-binding protein n=1 Tax=Oerskovia flava TaxID=2986422 RepID=UPI002240ACDB|nr:anchored repeat ABC transporter, substrate-binding protein [Oerskovia sp. JB1-3-2]